LEQLPSCLPHGAISSEPLVTLTVVKRSTAIEADSKLLRREHVLSTACFSLHVVWFAFAITFN
jgi:hypothetical protein